MGAHYSVSPQPDKSPSFVVSPETVSLVTNARAPDSFPAEKGSDPKRRNFLRTLALKAFRDDGYMPRERGPAERVRNGQKARPDATPPRQSTLPLPIEPRRSPVPDAASAPGALSGGA